MNLYLLAAGLLTIMVGLVHSILGEKLIFSRLREGTIVPTAGHPVLREGHVRIIWATWHLITIFGCGFAAVLIRASTEMDPLAIIPFTMNTIIVVMLCGSLLVGFATKGRHPGWIGLLGVAILTWLA